MLMTENMVLIYLEWYYKEEEDLVGDSTVWEVLFTMKGNKLFPFSPYDERIIYTWGNLYFS